MNKKKTVLSLLLSLGMAASLGCASFAQNANLKVLATTDVHTSFKDYNYYTDKEDAKVGLVRLATIIKEQKRQYGESNTVLVDNGDFIQGTPLGDYIARVKGLDAGNYVGVDILNYLGYDVATLGNHEFNYGLDYLKNVMKGAKYEYVSSNVLNYDSKTPFIKPYVIVDKPIVTENGDIEYLKVGIIGAVAPQITIWDSANLDKKITSADIVKSIQQYIPKMKSDGADIIIALSHSGMGKEQMEDMGENLSYQVSKIDGVDVVVAGHSHSAFPADSYKTMKNVDVKKGTVNGKAFNIAGSYADALGVIDLKLSDDSGKWEIQDATSKNVPVYDKAENKSVEADKDVASILEDDHNGTLKYIRSKIGTTLSPINSFFALGKDDSSIQLINNAQSWYAKEKLKGTEYEKLPVLSAAAPFKAGGRMGADFYTNIAKGDLAIKNMADLYVYPNTLYVLKINGADLKNWLEMSAGQFNQIDPSKAEKQMLVNNAFPTYNFDVIDGVSYKIDLTKPAKYDRDGKVINADAQRIVDLTYDGKKVEDNQEFAIATNNYRAGGGGKFPNINLKKAIYAAPDENRQIIVDYIMKNKEIDPKADENWSFANISDNKAQIILQSSPKAKDMVGETFTFVDMDSSTGYANYQVNMK